MNFFGFPLFEWSLAAGLFLKQQLRGLREISVVCTSDDDQILDVDNLNAPDWLKNGLRKALWLLDRRERYIIVSRWLTRKKKTLELLGLKFGISCERVRQIEKLALKKLKSHIESNSI